MDFLDSVKSGATELYNDASEMVSEVSDYASDMYDTVSDFVSPVVDLWNTAQSARISKNPPNQDLSASAQLHGLAGTAGNEFYNISKMKFSFLVEFVLSKKATDFIHRLSNGAYNVTSCSFMVKETALPSASFSTETLNQYNRTRLFLNKVKYNPVDLVLFDTTDSAALFLLDCYSKYYYGDFYRKTKNAWRYDLLTTNQNFEATAENWGKSVQNVGNFDNFYFFKQINIYEIDGDKYTAHNLFNPQLEGFAMDRKSHDSTGEPQTITLNLMYEGMGHLGPDGMQNAIAAPTLEIAGVITNTSLLGKGGFYKLYGEMDDKSVGTSIGDMIRGGAAVVDIFNDVKDIFSGDADADTIRNLGNAISTGASALDLSGSLSTVSEKFGLGSIFGD